MNVWLICVCGSGALFTGIGLYAMRRKEPMGFWAGTTVAKEQITDVHAYNRANGIMWMAYSVWFWLAGVLGIWSPVAGGIVLGAAGTVGMAALVLAYKRIYRKYLGSC